MSSYYTLQVSHSDVTVPGKSKAPNLYVKISYGDQTLRTSSVNDLPPQWNETFPITCPDLATQLTIKLKKEGTFTRDIGHTTCTLKDLLKESGEDIHIPLESKDESYPLIALCLQPSDRMKNAEITLINLAHTLLDIHLPDHNDFAENVDVIFDTAKHVAESKTCRSLVEVGYTITAFVKFGDSIANATPYLKLAWCITTAFIKIIAEQPRTDKRVKDLVKSLMNLFLINKETSIFANISESMLSIMAELFEFITQCSTLLQDYARKGFIVRAVLQNKKAAIDDLETTIVNLKTDLVSAFERQGMIEAEIRALRMELEKKLQPKHEGRTGRQICLEGTRVALLKEIEEWMQDTNAYNVFFVLGRAGTGKSTIATTIAEKYQRKGQLGSHQYFLREKSNPAFIFRTIAFDLANRSQKTAEAIKAQLDANDITAVTPERAFEILLSDPLHAISKGGERDVVLIVLDALDECGSRELRGPYIRLIKEKLQMLPSNYRFLITSRPEEDIASSEELDQLQILQIDLDHESDNARSDVLRYIQTKLWDLKAKGRIIVNPDWPWDESMKTLGDAAGGLFIWAATAVRIIESKKGSKAAELKRLVATKSLSLDDLYATALESSLDWDGETKSIFLKVFSLILFGKEQLTVVDFDETLGFDYGTTQSILNSLRSIVTFDNSQPVRLYHTSLYDYLISKETYGKAWFIDEEKEKACISLRCFELMEGLKFNICDLETSYKLNKDVPGLEERIKNNIHVSLLYACRHWASHLREALYSKDLLNQIVFFAFNQLLYWVEILSLTGSLHVTLSPSLESVINWIGDNNPQLSVFLQDSHDQFNSFIEPISQSCPHIYMTFLPLMKEDSIVAKHYAKRARSLTRVEHIGNKPRMSCTKQINVGKEVSSISYSPDGKRIVLGSYVDAVSVWDVESGKQLLGPLHGQSSLIKSVAYSADGRYIASGSGDGTAQVWEALTGESAYSPLVGHSESVNSVAFSEDGKYLASGSQDMSVRLWDVESGAPVGEPFRGSSFVESVAFSPNGRYLASGSLFQTITIWEVQSRKMVCQPFKGHSSSVTSLSFSPDSSKIASGSWDSTICVWEVSTGDLLRTFFGDGMGWVLSIAYSHDGKHILSGSEDKVVRMWNEEDDDAPPERFEGHTGWVKSVSFAPDDEHFASVSDDGTIRFWAVKGGVTGSTFEGQRGVMIAIAVSPRTGKFLVSASNDNTVCVWDVESGNLILQRHSFQVTSVAFSSDENHFASGSADSLIRIWNMIDDHFITCNGHTGCVRSIAFSPNGVHLTSGSDDRSIRVWNIENGSMKTEPFTGHTRRVLAVCYSPDGKKIASSSEDEVVRIWNASSGDLLSTFKRYSSFYNFNRRSSLINPINYSHDGQYTILHKSFATHLVIHLS